jgi:hypothetical protein
VTIENVNHKVGLVEAVEPKGTRLTSERYG